MVVTRKRIKNVYVEREGNLNVENQEKKTVMNLINEIPKIK